VSVIYVFGITCGEVASDYVHFFVLLDVQYSVPTYVRIYVKERVVFPIYIFGFLLFSFIFVVLAIIQTLSKKVK
jgi:hypothetical protein